MGTPNQRLLAYSQRTPDFVSVRSCIERLVVWHETLFQAQAQALEQGTYNAQQFALAARYAYWYVLCSEPLANRDRGGDILITEAAHALALQIIAGWQGRARVISDVLLKGLDSPMLTKGNSWAPHFWFMMHLATLWQGLPDIDIGQYNHSSAKAMAVYDAVLDDWKTSDVQQVAAWCNDMAEHHVRNAWEPDGDSVREFGRGKANLYPYEIFAYLRLREWQGLPNPDAAAFVHPLFQQPLGIYLQPLPDDTVPTPLLDEALQVYRGEYPELRQG